MSWSAVWPALLACLIYFAVIVAFFYGRAAWREWRGVPAAVPAETLRRMRELAKQVQDYVARIQTPQGLDEFVVGGRNTPGWTGPEQWLFLSHAAEIVKGQWAQEGEVESIRGHSMPWGKSVLTPEDDAIRLRAEAVWRMKRLLKFLTRDLG